ncbi:hypothetical protein D3C81_1922650 [compost metagenome]
MAGAPMASMACFRCPMVKFDTPIARVSPAAWACASASMYSATGNASPGDGQWISVRSTRSSFSFSRLVSRLARKASRPRCSVQILVVTNRSSRATPLAAIARPTSASLP